MSNVLNPSEILTRNACGNAIVVISATGGSTNAPIHPAALASAIDVNLTLKMLDGEENKGPLLVTGH